MERTIQRFHCMIKKMEISILYHVIVNSQLNRDNLTRCYVINLIKKLHVYEVEQHSLKLLESYLSNQSQTCFINGTFSNCKSVRCDIPQGSMQGPFFFLVYINDLPNCLNYCMPRMFAEDTTLTACRKFSQDLSFALNHS